VRAAARPHLGFVAGTTISEADAELWPQRAGHEATDDSLMSVQLPYLADMRRLALLLAADAQRAAADGDEATVLANIGAALSMSEHLRELPTLINELVAIAVFNLSLNTTLSLLHDQPEVLSEQSLRDLAHRIAGAHGGGTIQIDIAGERMWFYDMVQRIYTDDGRGGGRITAEGMQSLNSWQSLASLSQTPESPWYSKAAMPAATLVMANRRDIVAKFDHLMNLAEAEGRQPLWQRTGMVDGILSDMQTSPIQFTRYWPVVLLMPAVSQATTNGERLTIQRDATLVAIALELHRRRHGDWPASLDKLVPHLLPTVPVDRYDGQPLRYLVRDGSPVLYSIGMNRTDDGGLSQQDLDRVTRRMDGDWILWPPER
jgi:hypothetical protein